MCASQGPTPRLVLVCGVVWVLLLELYYTKEAFLLFSVGLGLPASIQHAPVYCG